MLPTMSVLALSLLQSVPQDVPRAWMDVVRSTATAAEYEFAQQAPELWSAPNRALELRVRASAAGFTLLPRAADWTGAGASWHVRIATRSFGRLAAVEALGLGELAVEGNRVRLSRPALEEQLVNDERGLEQRWTISSRPAGVEPLWIGIAVEGGVRLRAAADGLSATLVAPGDEVRLRYRDLSARDARGRALAAHMQAGPGGPGIRVDDAGALYPISVLAALSGPGWTFESDQAGARFGWSVASAGDVDADGHPDVLVGAIWYDAGEMNEGRVFLFPGGPSGPATTPAWMADGNGVFAELGWSLSTAGDVNGDGYSDVVVGAPNLANGQTDEGAAFVWLGSATGLGATPAWSIESNETSAVLGVGVGAAGDVNGDGYSDVAVGAPRLDLGQADEGAVLVFHGSAGGLSTTVSTTLQANQASSRYGLAVFSAGDVNGDGFDDLAVGADEFDNGQSNEGRAFVYHGSGTGLSTTPAWTTELNQANALLGTSVGTAGDVNADGFDDLLVGAPGWSSGQAGEGRALLYLGSVSGLAASAAWTFDANQASAALGFAVATAGDVDGNGYSDVAVGAPGFDGRGLAAVFLGSASGLGTTPAFTSPGTQLGSRHGAAVATSGDVDADGFADLLIGSWSWDGPDADEGRALWWRGGPEDPDEVWNRTGGAINAFLGTSVAIGGDVNGDGYSDVLLGAPGAPGGGMVFLHLGSADGPETTAAWTATSPQIGAEFGAAVAFTGDVNGDGYDDAIVGAPSYDAGVDSGGVFVYLGSPAGLAPTPLHTLFLTGTFGSMARFGAAVAAAGDVDGDGFADVLVGAPDRGAGMLGQAYLYRGSRSGLIQPASWTEPGGVGGSDFGASLAGVGDMNADGYSDVIIGNPPNNGSVSVYRGEPAGLEDAPWWTFSGQIVDELGSSVSSAGDVNGDAYSDVLVGAPGNERALLFLGSDVLTGLAVPDWTFTGPGGSASGSAVASAGDVNDDGYADVLVGAPLDQIGQTDEGIVRLFLGSANGPSLTPDWTWEGSQANANLGAALAGAGDANGDSFADFTAGGPGFTLPLASEGGVIVFHGNGEGGGTVLGPRQLRPNGAAPLALLGRSPSQDVFRLDMALRAEPVGLSWSSPGTHTAWLQWEVKPLGTPFDGTGVQQSVLGQPFGPSLPLPAFEELALRTGGHARPHVWRARIVTDHPLWPATPWVSRPGNTLSEAKLRFAPTSIPAAPAPQGF